MSTLAKAQPGDRTATVTDEDTTSELSSPISPEDMEAAKKSWAASNPDLADHDEEDTEVPKPSYSFDASIMIRDFGFPTSDPRHYGKPYDPALSGGTTNYTQNVDTNMEEDDDHSARYSGHATALYDFEAENPSELSFKEGQILNILYRQCAGWLVGEIEIEEEAQVEDEDKGGGKQQDPAGGGNSSPSKKGGKDRSRRRTVVKTLKGLVPENYVQIWGA